MHTHVKRFAWFIALTLIVCIPLRATEKNTSAAIQDMMNTYHEYGLFNGSILVAQNGDVVFKAGYGFANMEWQIPNTTDTRFRLASITKQFTAMLIMQLVAEGKIRLDAPLINYLPDYRKDIGESVTIHQLLNHTSGIPSYTSLPGFIRKHARDPVDVNAFINRFCNRDLEFEPGSRFKYNNSGYFILGAILERITGKPYATVLQERIFDPLDMMASGYDSHAAIIPKRADGYRQTADGFEHAPYLDMTVPYAAGSLYSTAEDLYKWDRALYTEKLLPAAFRKMMFTPHLNDYGYGWHVQPMKIADQDRPTVNHAGGIQGFNTLITRFVDDQHLIVLLNNTGSTRLREMTVNIARILYGYPAVEPKKPARRLLFRTFRDHGPGKGQALLEQFHADGGFDLSERELNRLGYQLLKTNAVDSAIIVFQKNVALYPDSANTYDSLAEAYLKNNDKKNTIKYYRKTLELNPDNPNAIKQLKKLGVAWKEQTGLP